MKIELAGSSTDPLTQGANPVERGRPGAISPATEELGLQTLEPLFHALDDPFVPIKCAALRALARLPLAADAAERLKTWTLDALSAVSGAATDPSDRIPAQELLAAAAVSDDHEVRQRLRELVADGEPEQRRVVAHELGRAGDEAAASQLVSDLSHPDAILRLRSANDLLQLDATSFLPQIQARFAGEADPQVRDALAILAARQGEPELMAKILLERKGQLEGSPDPVLFALLGEVATRGPLPEASRRVLAGVIAAIGDADTGPLSFIADVVGRSEALKVPSAPPSEWRPWGLERPIPRPAAELDAEAVGQFVTALVGDVVDKPLDFAANGIVELVWMRPDVKLDVPVLFDAYRKVTAPGYEGQAFLAMQLAWVLSRLGIAAVLAGLQRPLAAADPRERLSAADLTELVAIYVHYPEPPIIPGGMGPGGPQPTVRLVTDQLIEASQARLEAEASLRRPRIAARAEFEPVGPSASAPPIRGQHAKPPAPRAPGAPAADPPRTAYARVDCDSVVTANVEFALTVGIAPQQSKGVHGDVLKVPETTRGEYVLTVQVVVEGFTLRQNESWRIPLPVTAEQPYPAALLHLTPQPQADEVVPRTIQVLYSVQGQTIGAAFRPIAVVGHPALLATTPAPPEGEGADIGVPTAKTACDLTVRISAGESESLLLVTLETGAGFDSGAEPIHVDIGSRPDVFARQLVDKVNIKEGQPGSYKLLAGFGKSVADKLPKQFWEALRRVRQEVTDRPPTILFLSAEPYIPWELAVMEPPLIDPSAPPFLGAQANVGRWVLGPRVKVPPPTEIEVENAAVVWGIYNRPGWDRLREAEDEGSRIESDLGAVQVQATTAEVNSCLNGDPKADLIHFAVHGIYDPAGIQDGLVLTDGQALDPMEVRGSALAAAPFVFLNACQVGSGNRILGDYAGMAAAFLYAGAAGVVAPLWSIKDEAAKEIALAFYAKTRAGSPPADVFRSERGLFNQAAGSSTTYLAYQFFGHPSMQLVWKPSGPGGDNK